MTTESEAMEKIIARLNASPAFINSLSKFRSGDKVYPMLIQGLVLPPDWSVKSTSCMLSTISNSGQLEYARIYITAYCHAPTYIESRRVALALQGALNRKDGDKFFTTTNVLQTLPPLDGETDNYNTPVDILVRTN